MLLAHEIGVHMLGPAAAIVHALASKQSTWPQAQLLVRSAQISVSVEAAEQSAENGTLHHLGQTP